MFIAKNANLFTINSKFTRKYGYTNIESSKEIDHKRAIRLLNSFTPQGASPKVSLRIGPWHDNIGLGYYYMQNEEDAAISTIMINQDQTNNSFDSIPMSENSITNIANGNFATVLVNEDHMHLDLIDTFGFNQTSMIIYSILAGDNIIVIHPQHGKRVEFIRSTLKLVPRVFFSYNRITTGCVELDGNENIIGVEELPKSFRSHKKLYMPLDTIFIDIKSKKIMGEGLKSNLLTNEISQLYSTDQEHSKKVIETYFREIVRPDFSDYTKFGENTEVLTKKIRSKMGLEKNNQENWLMSF